MRRLLSGFIAALLTYPAVAQDIKPAIIYGFGSKFDHSFNEGAYNGAKEFMAATNVSVAEFEPTAQAQLEQTIRSFAARGQDPILAVGFAHGASIKKVSTEFPNTRFVIIDAVIEAPNVQSITFNEDQGAYLAGIIAALKSDGKPVGFVGGMDIPIICKFACGYVQGVKSVSATTEVFQNTIGATPSAWRDPVRGSELARSQMERGALVVFAAAGASGLGVLQAAADQNRFSIGVDANQDYLHPGSVLTSMVKRADVATRMAFTEAKGGTWKPGHVVLGLASDGVGVTYDEFNKDVITPEMRAAVEKAKAAIVNGTVRVHDSTLDGKCPA